MVLKKLVLGHSLFLRFIVLPHAYWRSCSCFLHTSDWTISFLGYWWVAEMPPPFCILHTIWIHHRHICMYICNNIHSYVHCDMHTHTVTWILMCTGSIVKKKLKSFVASLFNNLCDRALNLFEKRQGIYALFFKMLFLFYFLLSFSLQISLVIFVLLQSE